MNRTQRFFLHIVPATFITGTLFGYGISSGIAAFKGSAVFRDIPATHYADEAIGEMYSLGIIKGYDSSRFGPDDPITRGQVALLMKRLRDELKGGSGISSSKSSSSSSSVSSSSSSSVSSSSSSSSSVSHGALGVRFGAPGYNVDKNVAVGSVDITVVRTGGTSGGGGTVQYTLTGGTAVAGKDYVPISGTLTFQGTQTSQKLTVQIKNNTTVTGTKTVYAVLSNPTGGLSLADPASVAININDPSNPTLSSSSASVSSTPTAATTISLGASEYGVMENGGSLTVTVLRTGDTSVSQTVNYGTTNGTASSGSEYSAASGTFTFAAGETSKTITIGVNNNVSVDGNRTFTVFLSSPSGGSVTLGTASALVTINDDEAVTMGSGSIKLSSSSYTATVSNGVATITVRHIGGIGPVSVNYATANNSAQAGVHYSAVSGTLNFAANETSKTFTVPLAQNTVTTSLAFNVSLNSPVKAPLTDPTSATVTISN